MTPQPRYVWVLALCIIAVSFVGMVLARLGFLGSHYP